METQFGNIGDIKMTKNEVMQKNRKILNIDRRKAVLEKRLNRIEKLMKNESYDPKLVLYNAIGNGFVGWDTVCNECLQRMSNDQIEDVIHALDIDDMFDELNDDVLDDEEYESRKPLRKRSLVEKFKSHKR